MRARLDRCVATTWQQLPVRWEWALLLALPGAFAMPIEARQATGRAAPATPKAMALLQRSTSTWSAPAAAATSAAPGESPAAASATTASRRRRRQAAQGASRQLQPSAPTPPTPRRRGFFSWRRPPAALPRASLLASSGSSSQLTVAGSGTHSIGRQPQDASWFGDFSKSESTFDPDAVDDPGAEIDPNAGAKGLLPNQDGHTVEPTEWFQESASGGSTAAWQTFYPGSGSAWRRMKGLSFNNTYLATYMAPQRVVATSGETLKKAAEWFDSNVAQYDAFGRARAPSSLSDGFYIGWEDRQRTTTLTCGLPGCIAHGTLQIAAAELEQTSNCLLDVAVRATDFDDPEGREQVEWVELNGHIIKQECNPKASGCRSGEADDLHPCVSNMNIDHLLRRDGNLNISAKISALVDECPVEGNLLSAVVQVRCFVTGKDNSTTVPWLRPELPSGTGRLPATANATLQCRSPGCAAAAVLQLAPQAANRTCRLTVKVQQTDFGGSLGSVEEVEWIMVNNRTLREHVSPGRSPCKEGARGRGNATVEPYVLVNGEDVSAEVAEGAVRISAKISGMVDECATPEGYLLSAEAAITCGIPGEAPQEPRSARLGSGQGVESSNGTAAGANPVAQAEVLWPLPRAAQSAAPQAAAPVGVAAGPSGPAASAAAAAAAAS